MAAQKRSSGKNYIDLLEDGGDERRPLEMPPTSAHPMRDYLLSLVAAMRATRGDAR
ncbi:hypothetical protein [Bradyrhizobium sp.]|uniref:hypothetical protein n=1 Tax=Bradyrhizobium sp. TaxID=376 RepID=UPI001D77A8E0|nr:hypothetical protein [Bradyrhizobium sp.]MBI5318923.1 hypothetical protein [Bradyrhizobium sp.]